MGGDVGVFQQVEGDKLVVLGGFRIIEDLLQLLQMARAQEVVDVLESFLGQQAQAFRLDHKNLFAVEVCRADMLGGSHVVP